MATRAIVTSHPVVACDVCGRRLLRGETSDVFLAGGRSRTVCELCVPRAAAEGWLREADRHELGSRPARPRRASSLLGRLRQLREPEERPLRREAGPSRRRAAIEGEGRPIHEEDDDGLYNLVDDGASGRPRTSGQAVFIGAVQAEHSTPAAEPGDEQLDPRSPAAEPELTSGELKAERALEVFNAGETPRRVAGVARSLGAPAVVVRPVDDAGAAAQIVVAWELCWYRYEVDLGEEAAGARLAAEGTELDELPAEDRAANAAANERGELSLIAP
jgi:hypothetical protein